MSHKSIDGRKKNKKHFSGNYASSEKQNQVNQLEIMDVTVKVTKIELPQNEAPEIVEKLRQTNKLIDEIEKMKSLEAELKEQRCMLFNQIEILKREEKRRGMSLRQYQLKKMNLLKP